jgi:hypothetical protein
VIEKSLTYAICASDVQKSERVWGQVDRSFGYLSVCLMLSSFRFRTACSCDEVD